MNLQTSMDTEEHISLKAEKMITPSYRKFSTKNFKELDNRWHDEIININKVHNSGKLKQSKKYYSEFKALRDKLLQKYRSELTSNVNLMRQLIKQNNYNEEYDKVREQTKDIVNEMNKTINSEINILNQKYQDIVTIKCFKIIFNDTALYETVLKSMDDILLPIITFDLPLEDAIKDLKKQSKWSKIQKFFPGFYEKTLNFEYANEGVIKDDEHKIKQMVFGNWHDFNLKNSVFDTRLNIITYDNRKFELIGDAKNPLENVEIFPDTTNIEVQFKIGKGIKSLILKDNEKIIDLSKAKDLKTIYINDSNKYTVENGVLYEKDDDGRKGNRVNIPSVIEIIDNTDKEEIENFVNEYHKILEDFSIKQKDFMDWKQTNNIAEKDDTTKSIRDQANSLDSSIKKQFDIEKAKEFIKLANETIDMINKFKQEYTQKKVAEKEKLNQFYNKAKQVTEQFNKNISKFKDLLCTEYNINLEDDNNLKENDKFINSAKQIIDDAEEFIKYAKNEMKDGYTDESIATKLNKSLIDQNKELKEKIQKWKDENKTAK